MKTSVLIATYNGEQFIEEQLASICDQSLQPDEVLIRDDCSTDSTCERIRSFIALHGLSAWRLEVNECNLGFRKNFRMLAEQATGDVMFFCDQDDVWAPCKIETCCGLMTACSDIGLVCADYTSSVERPNIAIRAKASEEWDFERLVPHLGKPYVWLGCAMAARASFVCDIMPYWPDDWAHDECMWCMAEAAGVGVILHEPLLWHRLHGGNATGKKVHDRDRRIALVEEKSKGYAEVVRYCEWKGIAGEAPRLFKHMAGCGRSRAEFLREPSFHKALKLLPYLKYYPEVKSYPADLAIAFNRRGR